MKGLGPVELGTWLQLAALHSTRLDLVARLVLAVW